MVKVSILIIGLIIAGWLGWSMAGPTELPDVLAIDSTNVYGFYLVDTIYTDGTSTGHRIECLTAFADELLRGVGISADSLRRTVVTSPIRGTI